MGFLPGWVCTDGKDALRELRTLRAWGLPAGASAPAATDRDPQLAFEGDLKKFIGF